jgi:site-specific recombinase XerD
MTQHLAVIPPDASLNLPACLETEEMRAALNFAQQEKSSATRKCYASDFHIFTAWCLARGLDPLPASAETVARFLSAQATGGLKASTIGRRSAAIAYAHKLAGHQPPTGIETVRAVVRGIRRTIGCAPVRKAPATADLVQRMLDLCPDTLGGKRDRALLALGFAGAFRRSELVALDVADLEAAPDRYRVTIRHSKTDQEGLGQTIAIPRGCRIMPVQAVEVWLAAADITEGRVFRIVAHGQRLQGPLSGGGVAAVVKKYAARVGLDPATFGGHSLRSGFLTSSAEAGASVLKMIEVSRHKSVDMLTTYVRRSNLFREHAGSTFL